MSRTIITNSGSEFFTNISSEEFLGKICKDIGAKYFSYDYGVYVSLLLAYSMTKEEALDVSNKLKKLTESKDIELYYKKYKPFFEDGINIEEFKDSLLYYAELFEKSEGYKCI